MDASPGPAGPPTRGQELLGVETWRRLDLLLLAVVAVALWLRIQGANDEGFWLDEITSLRDAAKPLGEILAGRGRPGHPPLYYLLLKGWTGLFGTSETAVRLLSAIFGTAAVGMAYALFRALHGRAVGLAASVLLALSFHHIVFCQEARNYSLLGFLALATAHALWRALSEGGRKRWAPYVGCAILMAYTHHQAYVVLFGLLTGAILATTLGGMRRKGAVKGVLLADLAIVVAAVPSILIYMLGGFSEGAKHEYGFWQPHVSWQGLVDVAALWTPGGPLLAPDSFLYTPNPPRVPWLPWLAAALLLPAVFLALAWIFARRSESRWDPPSPRPPPTLFHAAALYVGVGAFLAIATLKPFWHTRYVFVYLPFFLGGIATLLATVRSRWIRAALLLALVLASLPGVVREKRVPGRTPWRETAAYLSGREGRAVYVIGPSFLRRPLGWYYKRPFEVVPDQTGLVAAVRAAAVGGPVLVVYCNAHSPPDPRHFGAMQLSRILALRDRARFGPLTVYEFAKRR